VKEAIVFGSGKVASAASTRPQAILLTNFSSTQEKPCKYSSKMIGLIVIHGVEGGSLKRGEAKEGLGNSQGGSCTSLMTQPTGSPNPATQISSAPKAFHAAHPTQGGLVNERLGQPTG
jgi:hypothetical protein